MSKLKMLQPRLGTLKASPVRELEAKAGTTKRIRGKAGIQTRERIALRDGYRCQACGCVWMPRRDHVDHIVRLEDGGTNDDSNLQCLCFDCHAEKTKAEGGAKSR